MYLVTTFAAIVISDQEIKSGFTKSQRWRRSMAMPIYVLGTLVPQCAPKKIMLGNTSISTLTLFLATFSLLIIQIFNSNLRARIMAVGKT